MIRFSIFPFVLFLMICGGSLSSFSQGFSWGQGISGTGSSGVGAITFDANNNIYVVGGFNGTVDFDRGLGTYNLTSIGGNNMFVLKEDPTGNFLWVKQFTSLSGGIGFVGRAQIELDAAGNILVTGNFGDTVDVDPGLGAYLMHANGTYHEFIVKLNSLGNFQWGKHFGGIGTGTIVNAHDMKLDVRSGNIFLSCSFGGTIDADPGPGLYNISATNTLGPDILIEKLDSLGNFIWAKQITGNNDKKALSLAIDSFSNLYLAGQFNGTVDFDPGPSTANFTAGPAVVLAPLDLFILKLDSAGVFQWVKQIGGAGDDKAQDISVDSFGNIVLTGYYAAGIIDFDPGPGIYNLTATSRDFFTLRLRNNGDFSWVKTTSSPGNDDALGVVTDGQGNVYTTGYLLNNGDIDPGPATNMLTGGFIQKLDSSGNFVWAVNVGGNWIGLDNVNSIYLTGSYTAPISGLDIDPGPTTFMLYGGGGFILKLCESFPTVSVTASNPTPCAGDTVVLTTPAVPGVRYSWYRNFVLLPDTTNSINVSISGSYVVKLSGSCPPTGTISVFFYPIANPVITLPATPMSAVIGQTVSITATLTGQGTGYLIDWYKNGVRFDSTWNGNVSYTKTAGTDTIFAVIRWAIDNPCYARDTSDTLLVFTTNGVEDALRQAGMAVYPNPFSNVLTVKGLRQKDKLTLVDMSGREVYNWSATKETESFNSEGLAPGHYVLKIVNDNGMVRVNVPVVKQ